MTPTIPEGWTAPSADEVRGMVNTCGGQGAVARASGYSRGAVGHWCTGRASVSWPVWWWLKVFAAERTGATAT